VVECLPSKQVVAGPSPVSRSITSGRATCLPCKLLLDFLENYQVAARAAGLSSATVRHVTLCITLFSRYLGESFDPRQVGAAEFRSFLAALRTR
jgi:hypothetical protein